MFLYLLNSDRYAKFYCNNFVFEVLSCILANMFQVGLGQTLIFYLVNEGSWLLCSQYESHTLWITNSPWNFFPTDCFLYKITIDSLTCFVLFASICQVNSPSNSYLTWIVLIGRHLFSHQWLRNSTFKCLASWPSPCDRRVPLWG